MDPESEEEVQVSSVWLFDPEDVRDGGGFVALYRTTLIVGVKVALGWCLTITHLVPSR